MVKLYMYKGCDGCRKAKKWLQAQDVAFEEVAIREVTPSKSELKEALALHDLNLRKLFNVSGGDYRSMGLKEKLPTLSTDEALELLVDNGNLVKRPFLATDKGCYSGFDEAIWSELVK
ncbi:Spx/MgsR family RNA polymerase-binding regulatory protein [Pelagicoccus sp. SDUM812003]|uniref:Spx/MgsR family RNA polymerase-binding regulatory protein n=1 Tax=Pelagicoccus sp. SDUM812003 TaxID=3041267 RepID=UPI00280EF750|nr:Spx/MgsR family RNA polymerase-binding regulatory protein [Pelagicoccus sp. SDUM812003]MDQ8202458.1 Spx/MgsR family RNA polymerase-binding regulatory protein [Pelagicoccus sp. SDUM812003]